jgi:hypothetical protein
MKMKTQKTFFQIGALIVFCIFLMAAAGCVSGEKIGKGDAVRLALHDARTIAAINNSAYNVTGISTANLGSGTQSQSEVYYISITVLDGSNKKVNVFVTYDRKVALVDVPYP